MNSSSKNRIRVLVVDDSPLIRKIMTAILSKYSEFELVGTAHNGKMALDKIARFQPDVITLDIEMPEMNGLETLQRIMSEMPTPVVMLSSYSRAGADLTFEALDMGAVDFIAKPHPMFSQSVEEIQDKIIDKIRTASRVCVQRINPKTRTLPSLVCSEKSNKMSYPLKNAIRPNLDYVVSIGVSTGGPKALMEIIPQIPSNIPAAFLIVQHMPVGFTRVLAERINGIASVPVMEASDLQPIKNGHVYLARGDHHLSVCQQHNKLMTALSQNGHASQFRPSIDVLMQSTADVMEDRNIGVIMTGMCSDGVRGVKAIKNKGGRVLAQDEETSTIFGMNKLAINSGYVDEVVPLQQIIPRILHHIKV
ncbi:chemotaxis response regulator protein-glutamate methylesterase [candidate division KSB1 bacterium]|nr:chemotaxis response regulator protein-glutamate methylesterase [candidate division KSB1 bacterium]